MAVPSNFDIFPNSRGIVELEVVMTKDILVFIEQRGGVILPAALQTISAAKGLAAKTSGKVAAALIGSKLGSVAEVFCSSFRRTLGRWVPHSSAKAR